MRVVLNILQVKLSPGQARHPVAVLESFPLTAFVFFVGGGGTLFNTH